MNLFVCAIILFISGCLIVYLTWLIMEMVSDSVKTLKEEFAERQEHQPDLSRNEVSDEMGDEV